MGSLPITYLGFPLHNKKISVANWNFLVEKIKKNYKVEKVSYCLMEGDCSFEFSHFFHSLVLVIFV
jgi:hypothetical protein